MNVVSLLSDSGELEEPADLKVELKRVLQSGDDASGKKRVATDIEEVVMNGDGVDGKNIFPYRGDDVFEFRSRFDEVSGCSEVERVRIRQRVAIDLAVCAQWNLID
jgi:hypothetical protein